VKTSIEPLSILSNVNDWLKFAETKNAALIALCGIILPVFLNFMGSKNPLMNIYAISGLVFLGISSFVSLISFLPALSDLPYPLRGKAAPTPKSDVFYAGIAAQDLDEFIESFSGAYEGEALSSLELQVTQQIHANSKITLRKYRYFSFALWVLLGAIFTPIVFVVMLILSKNGDLPGRKAIDRG
jgi:hypothetical protein